MTGPPALRIGIAVEGHDVDLTVIGELTYTTAPWFTAQVDEVLGPSRSLRLDVTGVAFCDSIGLSALIAAQRAARRVDGELVLVGVHGSLARNLAVTGAASLFTIVDAAPANPAE